MLWGRVRSPVSSDNKHWSNCWLARRHDGWGIIRDQIRPPGSPCYSLSKEPLLESILVRSQTRSVQELPDVVHSTYQVPAIEDLCFISILGVLAQRKFSPLKLVLVWQVLKANSHSTCTLRKALENLLGSATLLRLLISPQERTTSSSKKCALACHVLGPSLVFLDTKCFKHCSPLFLPGLILECSSCSCVLSPHLSRKPSLLPLRS